MGKKFGEAYSLLEEHKFEPRIYSEHSRYRRTIRPNSADDDYLSLEQAHFKEHAWRTGGIIYIHEDEVDDLIVYLTYWKKWRAEHAGQTN